MPHNRRKSTLRTTHHFSVVTPPAPFCRTPLFLPLTVSKQMVCQGPMKYTSTVYGATSGSIGGITYSRNRGGPYTRRRAIPSNPASERQGIARENLASAVASWTNNLDAAQRTAWQTYASATPTVDTLGQQIILSGQQMYVRTYTSRMIAGLTILSDAPTLSGLGNTPQYTADPIIDASLQGVNLTAEADDVQTTDALLVYLSRPVPQSRTPAHEPRRFQGSVPGVVLSSDFTYNVAPLAWDVTAGQLIRTTILIAWRDGRISAEASRDVIVQA